MPTPIEFDTPRLRLRQWREDDLTPFAALNADPEVMAHFPAPLARIGMHRSDEDFDHPAVPPDSPLRAHCLYRLDRDSWRAAPG